VLIDPSHAMSDFTLPRQQNDATGSIVLRHSRAARWGPLWTPPKDRGEGHERSTPFATQHRPNTRVAHINHDDTERYRGANPYARVRRHGARTIAATAHFATEGLDDGHIVAQESRHIDVLGPMPSTAELASAGRQVEVTALLEGVRRYVHGEVFVLTDRAMHFPA
jgi:Formyl transferase